MKMLDDRLFKYYRLNVLNVEVNNDYKKDIILRSYIGTLRVIRRGNINDYRDSIRKFIGTYPSFGYLSDTILYLNLQGTYLHLPYNLTDENPLIAGIALSDNPLTRFAFVDDVLKELYSYLNI